MDYEFKLPDLGEGVAEGEVLKWMVREGDAVREDQPLVEVMTDKVNVQIPAPRSGKVSRILVKEGETAKVGQTMIVIAQEGAAQPVQPAPAAPRPVAPVAPGAIARPAGSDASGVLATPATRRLARELGVEIGSVKPTGPGGRITDEDVRRAVSTPAMAATVQTQRPLGPEEQVPLRGVRRTIADRMVKSRETTAQVTHVDEVDMTEVVKLRENLKPQAEGMGVKLTYLPFIIKATIAALREFPYVNSSLDEQSGNIVLKKFYNFGIATDTDQGLLVPVLRDADKKDVFALAREIEGLAERARKGQLSLDEVHGGTFTITNVGAIGGLFATPLINLPEVAIMGVHKIAKRPVVRDGKIEARDMMYISLSFDHRVFDGAYAARFTTRVIETMQDLKKMQSLIA
ncbi:MAG TPA: dihydrolipoamide acetyltransferase family protein [Nitrososphaerales archaeon]|nr:dihydrolipoamide acetyltransferase family protein [Nitrososphaerales archaeon]